MTKEAEEAQARIEAEVEAEAERAAGLYGDALRTYDALLSELVQAEAKGELAAAVEGAFERCDYSLLALAAKRLEQAAARLGTVMQQGSPEKMFAKIQELAIINQIDAPLVELLDANRQQALAAGAA